MNRLIILDTNVVIAAGINPDGPPAKIAKQILEGELILLTCPNSNHTDEIHRHLGSTSCRRDQPLKLLILPISLTGCDLCTKIFDTLDG